MSGACREMIVTLDTCRPWTAEQVRAFLGGSGEQDVKRVERAAADDFITRTSNRLGHARLSRSDKGVVRQCLTKMTVLSRARTFRVRRWRSAPHA